jgi:chorismate mutase/prephenate dehydratase
MESIYKLKPLRDEIDIIDEKILELLNKRANIALEVAKVKREMNLEYYSPDREREIIERLLKINKGVFPNNAVKIIFKEIFCTSLSLEQPITVAYLGPQATFSHMASMRYFGSACSFSPVNSIREVFVAVESENADFGVVPSENSSEGAITYTLDMFMDYNLKICAEMMLEISQHLLSRTKVKSGIHKIYSMPVVTAQCRRWLERNMLGVPILEAPSTAQAAAIAAREDGSAAIGSELAAKIYDLNFIERHIEDFRNNVTRFLIISKKCKERPDCDKTSIMFTAKDIPGSLHEVLAPFKKAKINLTKIESRPTKKRAWDYIFFVDFEGNIEDKNIRKTLAEVEKHCINLKVLGSYHSMDKPDG